MNTPRPHSTFYGIAATLLMTMLAGGAAAQTSESVSGCVDFTFTTSADGWQGHGSEAFTSPDLFYNFATPGTLDVTTTDNVSNFGYWESPVFQLVETTSVPFSSAIPISVPHVDGTSLFVAHFNLVSDASDSTTTPEIRLRTTAENSQQSDLAVISSNGSDNFSPSKGNRSSAQLYFKPAAGSPDFRLQFDVLNFNPGDSATATVGLDSASICHVPNVDLSAATTEAHYTFDDSDEGWNATRFLEFRAPAFSHDIRTGSLQLTAVPSGDYFEFGYWSSSEASYQVRPLEGRLYFAEFTVESDQVNASQVPSFRLRINESSFRVAQCLQVASTGSSFNSPTIGNPKTYTVFLPPDVATDGAHLIYSFDLMTQDADGDSTSAVLSLTDVVVKSIALHPE